MTFNKKSEDHYEVVFDNGVVLGVFLRDVDGYFYYWPEKLSGAWEAHILRAIADKLDEINKPWDEQIRNDITI